MLCKVQEAKKQTFLIRGFRLWPGTRVIYKSDLI
jgi:hypothetical protein